MNNIDNELRAALAQKPDKRISLVKSIIDNWDEIENAIELGVTIKQIVTKMNVSYSYFINARITARKKMTKSLLKNKIDKLDSNSESIAVDEKMITSNNPITGKQDNQEPTPRRRNAKIIRSATTDSFEANKTMNYLNPTIDDN